MELAKLIDNKIVIEIAVGALPMILEGGFLGGYYDKWYTTDDPEEFAKEVVNILNEEKEDGSTFVTKMMDQVILHTIEYGHCEIEEKE